ncbi:MAG: alanine racemase [Deltaproteobacteria bacterium]|nr:alanine racemase [Deltaproteobacteria bacterium]
MFPYSNNRVIAEINLKNLLFNFRSLKKQVKNADIIPVIKADAYGHGAIAAAKTLIKEKVKLFAVASFQEAMELKDSGINTPILILGSVFPNRLKDAVKAGLKITVSCCEDLLILKKTALKTKAFIHVKIDTGMGRRGIFAKEAPAFFSDFINLSNCVLEGIYSHFATSDTFNDYAGIQLEKFNRLILLLFKKGIKPKTVHMANSGAILNIPESYFDAVRPGISLYGHYPSSNSLKPIKLKQVMSLKSYVEQVRKIPADYSVSYGRRWISKKETSIAVISAGYADGVDRRLTNKGKALIKGKKYPIVGTVTMDYIMVDIGDDPIFVGDEVIIWGGCKDNSIKLLDLAEQINTIPYELTCGVSKRVKRVYI